MEYQVENLFEIRDEFQQLFNKHWEDVALDHELIKLSPNWRAYEMLDKQGKLFVVTARDAGVPVGYVFYIVHENLHYKDWPTASGDMFFLLPEYRRGGVGSALMEYAEGMVKEAGARIIFNRTKMHKDVGAFFQRMGYTEIERVYKKIID